MGKKVILKDVATLLNGRAYKQDELLDSGKYPVLRVGNFFSNRGWFYSDLELEDEKYCDNGDLLFAWSASFGPKIWDGGKVIFHYHIWKILTTPQIDKKYFYYFLENAADRIKESGHGIAMIHTTKSEMEQMELLLPEMEQQLQIATVLDKVSELIALRKEQLAKLDELVKARFVEMFGDLEHTVFPKCKMAEIADIKHGYAFSGKFFTEEDNNILLVTPGNFKIGGGFQEKKCKFYTGEYPDEFILHSGDLIVTMTDLSKRMDTLGYAAIVPQTERVYLHNQRIGLFINISNLINKTFMMHFMQTNDYRDKVVASSTGSTVHHTSPTKILDCEIFVPPIELQSKFASFVEQTDKTKLTIQASLDKLELMKKALMQEYFG